ncbi:Homocysteine S-methyltransferase 1 [Aphelenchoides fujianensis]|nr:Homocysteine S-methyltransferase 1 [Aphelenchoides fujianensis]
MSFQPFDFSRLTVLDGGMGSLIEELGYDTASTVAWSSGANTVRPDLVVKAHSEFIKAGAEVIMTNTYQANIKRLSHSMHQEDAVEYVNKGVELAVKAAKKSDRPVHIVGSIGPFATFICDGSEYTGSYANDPSFDLNLIHHNYETQARALANRGIRVLAFETIPAIVEASYARRDADRRVDHGPDHEHLANGEKFVDFVRAVADSPFVRAIGINCTSPENIRSLLLAAQPAAKGKPFVVYPNSGEVYDCTSKVFYGDVRVGKLVDELDEWVRLGVRLIGGCCRVMPEDLRKIADRVNELRK